LFPLEKDYVLEPYKTKKNLIILYMLISEFAARRWENRKISNARQQALPKRNDNYFAETENNTPIIVEDSEPLEHWNQRFESRLGH
jgi:hypothetical protein